MDGRRGILRPTRAKYVLIWRYGAMVRRHYWHCEYRDGVGRSAHSQLRSSGRVHEPCQRLRGLHSDLTLPVFEEEPALGHVPKMTVAAIGDPYLGLAGGGRLAYKEAGWPTAVSKHGFRTPEVSSASGVHPFCPSFPPTVKHTIIPLTSDP